MHVAGRTWRSCYRPASRVVGSVNLQYIEDQRDAVEKITGKKVTRRFRASF